MSLKKKIYIYSFFYFLFFLYVLYGWLNELWGLSVSTVILHRAQTFNSRFLGRQGWRGWDGGFSEWQYTMSRSNFQSGQYIMSRSNFQSVQIKFSERAVHNVQIKFSEWPVHNVLAGPAVHGRLVCDSGATFHGMISPHGIIGSSFFVLIIIIM